MVFTNLMVYEGRCMEQYDCYDDHEYGDGSSGIPGALDRIHQSFSELVKDPRDACGGLPLRESIPRVSVYHTYINRRFCKGAYIGYSS